MAYMMNELELKQGIEPNEGVTIDESSQRRIVIRYKSVVKGQGSVTLEINIPRDTMTNPFSWVFNECIESEEDE